MVLRELTQGQSGLPVPNSTHSYWHKDPSARLTGHRSTPDLPTDADTIIIGTGMTGAFAARTLKEHSPPSPTNRLLVLDAREACWGATGRNGGHCQPFLYGTSEEAARFELETYAFLRDMVAREGVDCGWRGVHGVHAVLSRGVFDALAGSVARLRRRVPDFADLIAVVGSGGVVGDEDGAEAPGWARGLTLKGLRLNRPGVEGAVVQRYAASLWPYRLVCHVLEGLVAGYEEGSGFNLQTNTPVTGLARDSSSGRWTVTTPRGRVSAPRVLLTTNAYTSRLLPGFSDLIVPVRGQVAALVPPGTGSRPRVGLEYSYVFFGKMEDGEDGKDTTRDEYLVQRPAPGAELILGGGRHAARGMAVGEWRDDVVEPEVSAWLRNELEPVLCLDGGEGEGEGEDDGEKEEEKEKEKEKEEGGLKASMEWTGIMGYSRDHAPWVGEVPESLGGGKGLFIASGFNGHGMPNCALAGRGVARMMHGDMEGHGLPKSFLVSEERAVRARKEWGPVGSVDEMDDLLASL